MNRNNFYTLVTKILSGEATSDDKQLFKKYLQYEEYEILYQELKEEWDREVEYHQSDFDYNRGLSLLRRKIGYVENLQTKKRSKTIRLVRTISIAASIIILFGLGYIFSTINKKEINIISYSTQRGDHEMIKLPDGSKVYLNSNSTIYYPERFYGGKRSVELEGEAFFEVVRNPQKPFIVKTNEVSTRVLGTSFNILESYDNISVTVETGKVKVIHDNYKGEVILTKGEQVKFYSETGTFIKANVKTEVFTGWRNGILYFNEIPLEEAMKQIENWYNVSIDCSSSSILKRTIRGKYDNEPLEAILKDMEFMFGFRYTCINDSTIIIRD